MTPSTLYGAVVSATLKAGVSLISTLQGGDWVRVSIPPRYYISTYIATVNQHQNSIH